MHYRTYTVGVCSVGLNSASCRYNAGFNSAYFRYKADLNSAYCLYCARETAWYDGYWNNIYYTLMPVSVMYPIVPVSAPYSSARIVGCDTHRTMGT